MTTGSRAQGARNVFLVQYDSDYIVTNMQRPHFLVECLPALLSEHFEKYNEMAIPKEMSLVGTWHFYHANMLVKYARKQPSICLSQGGFLAIRTR